MNHKIYIVIIVDTYYWYIRWTYATQKTRTVQCYSTSSSCQNLKNDILVSAVVLLLLPPHPHGHICTQRQVQLQYTNVHSLCMLSFLLDLWLCCTPKYKLIMMEAYILYSWSTVNFVRTQTHMCLISIPSPLSSCFFSPCISLSMFNDHCLDPQAVGASKEEVLPTNEFLIAGLHIMLMTFAWGNSVHWTFKFKSKTCV